MIRFRGSVCVPLVLLHSEIMELAEVISGFNVFKCVHLQNDTFCYPCLAFLFFEYLHKNLALFPARTADTIIFSARTLFKIG